MILYFDCKCVYGAPNLPLIGTGSVAEMDIETTVNEDPLVSSIKVSSASIKINRSKSNPVPLAKRRLLLRGDNKITSNPNIAQVIVTKYEEEK